MQALDPLINEIVTKPPARNPDVSTIASGSKEREPTWQTGREASPDDHPTMKPHVFELASFNHTHIAGFAQRWPDVEWWGSARDTVEVQWAVSLYGFT